MHSPSLDFKPTLTQIWFSSDADCFHSPVHTDRISSVTCFYTLFLCSLKKGGKKKWLWNLSKRCGYRAGPVRERVCPKMVIISPSLVLCCCWLGWKNSIPPFAVFCLALKSCSFLDYVIARLLPGPKQIKGKHAEGMQGCGQVWLAELTLLWSDTVEKVQWLWTYDHSEI